MKTILHLIAVVGSFLLAGKFLPSLSPDNLIGVAGIVATVAGILSGFSLSAVSTLVGMSGNRIIKALNKQGLIAPLLHAFNVNSVALVMVSVVALISMIFVKSQVFWGLINMSLDVFLLSISLSLMCGVMVSFVYSWHKLSLVISAMSRS